MKKLFSNTLNIILVVGLITVLFIIGFLAFNLLGLGNKDVIVPDFNGKTIAEVETWIKENEISAEKYVFEYQYDETIPENQLIYQSIKANDKLKDKITFVFSKGIDPSTIVVTGVPDFNTMLETEMKKWGEDNSVVMNIDYAYSDTVEKGKVISQTPVGQDFKSGDIIDVLLSKGPASQADTVVVPDTYIGYSEQDFVKTIEELGLKAVKQDKTYENKSMKDGTIYGYDSTSDGITFHKGDTVKYYLVKNTTPVSDTVIVPDTFIGLKEADFIKKIEELGLKASKQSTTYKSSKYQTGTIYAYDSTSDGITFKKGDTVKYYLVDNGDSTSDVVVVPDTYLGYSEADFIKAIEALGLKAVKQSKTYTSQKYQTGQVYIYDSTSDGITFHKGDTVKYYLVDNGSSSSDPTPTPTPTPTVEKVTLDNLVGMSEDAAKQNLTNKGLTSSSTQVYSSTVEAGKVISMSPVAGSTVDKGTNVVLTISKGPEPIAEASLLAPNFLINNYSKSSYQDTVSALTEYFNGQGFTNVSYSGISSTKSVGEIVSISVNGKTNYSAGNYPVNTPIVVQIVNETLN